MLINGNASPGSRDALGVCVDQQVGPLPELPERKRPKLLPRTLSGSLPPSQQFPKVFPALQMGGLHHDSKVIADLEPRLSPDEINKRFDEESAQSGFKLRAFYESYFEMEKPVVIPKATAGQSCRQYCRTAWQNLTIPPIQPSPGSSRLETIRPSVVPGDRFSESNYWDTHWIVKGLLVAGKRDAAFAIVQNTADQIRKYGHVPNGLRTYQIPRSQPPVFAMMVEALAESDNNPDLMVDFLPEMLTEHSFWMNGSADLQPGEAHRRAVCLPNGTILNRYYDDGVGPRDEAFKEDWETAHELRKQGHDPDTFAAALEHLFRDLKAACESGWDFSTRWFAVLGLLHTVRTTQIAPVDLNCFLANLERTIAKTSKLAGEPDQADDFAQCAELREAAIRDLMWSAEKGHFVDVLWQDGTSTDMLSAAAMVPLSFGIATETQAHATIDAVWRDLKAPGGLMTTPHTTGQQWDGTNGWAPLQDLAITGCQRYGRVQEERDLARSFLRTCLKAFKEKGTNPEKYDVSGTGGSAVGGGGEYEVQCGFGWSNGVISTWMQKYPDIAAEIEADVEGASLSQRVDSAETLVNSTEDLLKFSAEFERFDVAIPIPTPMPFVGVSVPA